MKVTFGRKFWAGMVAVTLLTVMFLVGVFKHSDCITAQVVIVYGVLIVTVCFAYIGGNVWKSWIISKNFHTELLGK